MSLHRMQIIKDADLTVLDATIDDKLFQSKGLNYLHENCKDISADTGFILDNIAHLVSKWMKYDWKSIAKIACYHHKIIKA